MKSKESTKNPVCKICFKEFKKETLISFIDSSVSICPECFFKLNHSFQKGKIDGTEIMSLSEYKPPLSDLLIKYKETLDYELHSVFLSYLKWYLKTIYDGYSLVIVPSSEAKIKKRGFNHLKEIFSMLDMPFIDVLNKDDGVEQKKKNALERRETASSFHIKNGNLLTNKKILLVDDVITTGTSLRSCLLLIKQQRPKKLKILVLMNDSPLSSYK
jgi:competence protein ComFC